MRGSLVAAFLIFAGSSLYCLAAPLILDPWIGVALLNLNMASGIKPALVTEVGDDIYFTSRMDEKCRGLGLFVFNTVKNSHEKLKPIPLKIVIDRKGTIKELSANLCIRGLSNEGGVLQVAYSVDGKTFSAALSGDTLLPPFGAVPSSDDASAWEWKQDLHLEQTSMDLSALECFFVHQQSKLKPPTTIALIYRDKSLHTFSLTMDFTPRLADVKPFNVSEIGDVGHAIENVIAGQKGYFLEVIETKSGVPHIVHRTHLGEVSKNATHWGPDVLGAKVLASTAYEDGLLVAVRGRAGRPANEVSFGWLRPEIVQEVEWTSTLPQYLISALSGIQVVRGGLLASSVDPPALFWWGRHAEYPKQDILLPSLEDISSSEYEVLKGKLGRADAKKD